MTTLKIGTRGSPLALWQARWVAARLQDLDPSLKIEIVTIVTSADKNPRANLTAMGGKGLFVKEIEEALLAHRIDLAVHSMKDVPTELPKGLVIAAIPHREDPRDVLVSRSGALFWGLAPGSRVATSSLRRACQLRAARGDLSIVPIRGNVGTRLDKLDRGDVDAIVLALAGVKRLGLEKRVTEIFGMDLMIPAIGQGALGVETRIDGGMAELLRPLDDGPTRWAVESERALARRLGATCQTPIGAHGWVDQGRLRLDAVIASHDGRRVLKDFLAGPPDQAEELGRALANKLLAAGAGTILSSLQ